MPYPKGWFGKQWFDRDWFPDSVGGAIPVVVPPPAVSSKHRVRPPRSKNDVIPFWMREKMMENCLCPPLPIMRKR